MERRCGKTKAGKVFLNEVRAVLRRPDEAVQHGTEGLYSYVVGQDNKAELRKVKVGQSIDGRSVIDQGLSPGEKVIVSGQFKVAPGTLVSVAVASSDPAQPKVKQE